MGLIGGGRASALLLEDALGSYVHRLFVATIVCSHASCERELAGRLEATTQPVPKGSERWGLGALLSHAEKHEWYSQPTLDALRKLNARRKDLYHFSGQGMGALFERTYAQLQWRGKHHIREDTLTILRGEALEALDTALAIRREELESAGFS